MHYAHCKGDLHLKKRLSSYDKLNDVLTDNISIYANSSVNYIMIYGRDAKKECGFRINGATDNDVLCAKGWVKTIGTDIASLAEVNALKQQITDLKSYIDKQIEAVKK